MSPKHVKSKHSADSKAAEKPVSRTRKQISLPKADFAIPANTLIVRLIASSLLFAVALVLRLPTFVSIILLVISALAAGCDIALESVNQVEAGEYFSLPVLVVFVAVISFFIGFPIEGASLVILYQIGRILLNYAKEHSKKAALDLLSSSDSWIAEKYKDSFDYSKTPDMSVYSVMKSSSGFALKIAIVFAVLYAILLPLITNFSYVVSIHRGLVMLLIATPMSVVTSISLCGFVGQCYAAREGVVFEKASDLETLADTGVAVFEKNGIFTDELPQVVSLHSDAMDTRAFISFAANCVYYSEQPFAKAIAAVYEQDYMPDIIHDFREIPGYGVELSINGINVLLATREYLASRGIVPTQEDAPVGTTYHMTVAGKSIGLIAISSEVTTDAENLISELKASGIGRCILLSEQSKESEQDFAEMMGFTELYPHCDSSKKFDLISDIVSKSKRAAMYVFSGSHDFHSDAAIDIKIGKDDNGADAFIDPVALSNLPFAKQVSVRVREVAIANSVFAFCVKALLIFMSVIGFCNLWLAILVDYIVAVLTVLNSIRVTKDSLIRTMKYKSGR